MWILQEVDPVISTEMEKSLDSEEISRLRSRWQFLEMVPRDEFSWKFEAKHETE